MTASADKEALQMLNLCSAEVFHGSVLGGKKLQKQGLSVRVWRKQQDKSKTVQNIQKQVFEHRKLSNDLGAIRTEDKL